MHSPPPSRSFAAGAARPATRLALAGAIVLATGLRVLGADQGLWVDEMLSLEAIRLSLREMVASYPGDYHHPLYSLLAHASTAIFGLQPWALRLPSIVAGVATVPLVYRLAARVGPSGAALLSAFLVATSYHHIWFSQNARGYTLLCFWALLATLLLRDFITTGRRLAGAAYAVCLGLGSYTHLTMVFLALGQAAAALVWIVRDGRRTAAGAVSSRLPGLLASFAGGAGLTLLLYAPMLPDLRTWFVDTPSVFEGLSTPTWAIAEGLRGLSLGLGGSVAAVLATLAGAVGWRTAWRRDPLSALLLMLPAFVVVAGAVLVRGTLYPRFFFFLLPFFVILEVVGAADVAARLLRPSALPAAAAALVVLSCVPLVRLYRVPKQDFEGAMAYVEREAPTGDAIATAGAAEFCQLHYGRPWPILESAADLEDLRSQRTVWVLYTLPRFLAHQSPGLMADLAGCELMRHFPATLGGGDFLVRRCPRPAAPPL